VEENKAAGPVSKFVPPYPLLSTTLLICPGKFIPGNQPKNFIPSVIQEGMIC